MSYQCPWCGRFLAKVKALVYGDGHIDHVEGRCRRHGKQHVDSWVYEDFFPEPTPRPQESIRGRR